MRLEHLREFVALANYGNFRAAARHLYISQPTLSNHIKSLESELGFSLVDRAQGNRLTAEGSLLLEAAQSALVSIDEALLSCKQLAHKSARGEQPVRLSVMTQRDEVLSLLEKRAPVPCAYAPYDMNKPILSGFADNSIDIVCTYQLERFPTLKAEAERLGLSHANLGNVTCLIAMRKSNPLASGELTSERLRGATVAVLSAIEFGYWKTFLTDLIGPEVDLTFLPIVPENLESMRAIDLGSMICVSPAGMINDFFGCREGYAIQKSLNGMPLSMPASIVWRSAGDNDPVNQVVDLIRGEISPPDAIHRKFCGE